MHPTSSAVEFIQNMAQEQIRYGTFFQEQAEVLRADPSKFEAAMAQIQQSPFVAKGGQPWEPTQDNADEYLAYCDDICRLVPQDFDDRVKILHAAYAALTCLSTCKIARQHTSVQSAISKRQNELMVSKHPQATPPTTGNCEAPLPKLSVEPRHITAEELRLFQNPANLHGKQFILSPGNDDASIFGVIGYSVKRDKTVEYDVLFDDCVDPILVDAKEMMGMLEDSLYLPEDPVTVDAKEMTSISLYLSA